MNKLITRLSLTAAILGASAIYADGFESEKKEQLNTESWVCEYCPEQPLWDVQFGAHIGLISDDIYRYSNYTGVDSDSLFLSGIVRNINPNGEYWITVFNNLGTDAPELNSRYGIQGLFNIEFDFKTIPLRKYDQLSSVFMQPNSTVLRLDDNWSRSNNTADFSDPSLYTQFSLGTDWDQIGLNLSYRTDHEFDYSFDYHRIEKNGLREASANQYFQAVYMPLLVDSISDDMSARVNYIHDDWFATIAVKLSRFDNNVDSITFANPFISSVSTTMVSDDPDNTAINASFNLRYSYQPRSYIKAYFSYGLLQQDEPYLPYTTNQTLLMPLEQTSLDGEVETENLSLKMNHWFNSQWTLRAKYNYRNRYNKTKMQIYRPVISDLFMAESIINIPYDLNNQTGTIDVDWRFLDKQVLTLAIKSHDTERNFQTVRKTSEDSISARYRAFITDELQFHFNGTLAERSGSAAELVDLISVTENPLLQRFNVSQRDHYNLTMQFNYVPLEQPFAAVFSVQYFEDDYTETDIGLQYSWQHNVNLDLNWHIAENTNLVFFVNREIRETTLGGSEQFAGRDWLVDDDDKVISYGINFAVAKLLDEKLSFSGTAQYSVGDTAIAINNAGNNSILPITESLWAVVELKAEYEFSENLDFAFVLVYQDFESHDFAIDDVVPGAAADLLTFSAMSNNYDMNYMQFSVLYRF